jgi:ATP-binding cassette, subfamily B, bacterial
MANYVSWILTQAQHAKEIRVYDLGEELRRRYQLLREEIRRERFRMARQVGLENALTQIAGSVVVFGSFAFIAWQTVAGPLTVGDLVMYFGAVQRGHSSLQGLFSGLGSLYEDNLFLSNLSEFLNIEDRVIAKPDPIPVPDPIRHGIEFNSVTFRYPLGSRPVLQEVTLRVRPGEMVALVGSNGSGKTSLVKLLCRLYDPDEGSVTVDGIDLRDLDPTEYRKRVGIVFQDYAKYGLSVADNIGFGNSVRLSEHEDIQRAARTAGIADVIERLPGGYDTVLGRLFQQGEELSIGEWQKVALARAFFSSADILVVDEPTSSLDAEAEAEIFRSIRELIRDRIAFVISHRFSTVRMADRIYVLDSGKVVESGTHDELMALNGRYAHLFNIQAAPYAAAPSAVAGTK